MSTMWESIFGNPKKEREIIKRDELLQEIEELWKFSGIKLQGMKGPMRTIEELNLQGKAHLNNIAYELGRDSAPLKDIQEVQKSVINYIESFKDGMKDLQDLVKNFEKKVTQLSKLVQKNEFDLYRRLSTNVQNYKRSLESIPKDIQNQLDYLSTFVEHYEELKDKSKEEEKMLKAQAKKRKHEPKPHPSGFKVEYDDKRNPYTESRRDKVDPTPKKQKKDSKTEPTLSDKAMQVMIDLSHKYTPENVLSSSSTKAEIRKAYRKLVIKLHPDKGGNIKEFQVLDSAYRNLKGLGKASAKPKGKKKKKQTKKKKKKGGGLQSKRETRKRSKRLHGGMKSKRSLQDRLQRHRLALPPQRDPPPPELSLVPEEDSPEDSPVVSPTARKHIRMQMVKNAYKFEILEEHIDHIYIPLLLGLEPNKEIFREHLRLIDEKVMQLNDLGVRTDQEKLFEQLFKNVSQTPVVIDRVNEHPINLEGLNEVSSKLEKHLLLLRRDRSRKMAEGLFSLRAKTDQLKKTKRASAKSAKSKKKKKKKQPKKKKKKPKKGK